MPKTKKKKILDSFEEYDETQDVKEIYFDLNEVKKSASEKSAKQEQKDEPLPADEIADEAKLKQDILSALPNVEEVQKPAAFQARTSEEKEYAAEHAGLPITEERSEEEMIKDEAEQIKERQEAKKELEAHKEDLGTLRSAAQLQQAQAQKSEEQLEVEAILSGGLEEQFRQLPPKLQQEFKAKGEQTASKIVILLKSAKVKVMEILTLIKNWLKMIPGVNKYFLEQESKIRTDKLLKLKKDKEGQLE